MKKLTLVNVDVGGKNYPAFVMLPVDKQGRVHVPASYDLRKLCGIPNEMYGACMRFNGAHTSLRFGHWTI